MPAPLGLTAMGRELNAAVLDAAELTVTICIQLIGIMALWLGLLNIAKDAGLVTASSRRIRAMARPCAMHGPVDTVWAFWPPAIPIRLPVSTVA
jgi:spore maturation protein SpmA